MCWVGNLLHSRECRWCRLACHLIRIFSPKNIFLYTRLYTVSTVDSISHSKYNIFSIVFWCISVTETFMILYRQIESKDISSSSYIWINYSAHVGWKCLIRHEVSENHLGSFIHIYRICVCKYNTYNIFTVRFIF